MVVVVYSKAAKATVAGTGIDDGIEGTRKKRAVTEKYKRTDEMRWYEALSERIYPNSMCTKVFGCLAQEVGDHAT